MQRASSRDSGVLGLRRRLCVLIVVTTLAPVVATTKVTGEILYESGALGPTGLTFGDFNSTSDPSGSYVSDFAFTGVRFELTRPAVTTRVGGHFVIDPGHDDSFFGAIVRLDSGDDIPDSGDLSTPDVLGQTLLNFPTTSAEVFGDLVLSLTPGWHVLVFGSGLFATTGQGGAPANNPDIGAPSYIGYQSSPGWFEISPPNGPFHNFRFVIEGITIPEPNSVISILMSVALMLSAHRSRR
jgi:hypothetical protein